MFFFQREKIKGEWNSNGNKIVAPHKISLISGIIDILLEGGMYLPQEKYNISDQCANDVHTFKLSLLELMLNNSEEFLTYKRPNSYIPKKLWPLQSKALCFYFKILYTIKICVKFIYQLSLYSTFELI